VYRNRFPEENPGISTRARRQPAKWGERRAADTHANLDRELSGNRCNGIHTMIQTPNTPSVPDRNDPSMPKTMLELKSCFPRGQLFSRAPRGTFSNRCSRTFRKADEPWTAHHKIQNCPDGFPLRSIPKLGIAMCNQSRAKSSRQPPGFNIS
jgi:hypothetical protein